MFFKVIAFPAVKLSIAAFAVFSAATMLGLPVNDPWFDILVLSWMFKWFFMAMVNAMLEPTEHSSDWYVWAYRFLHSLAHIGTAYFSHKRMWKFIAGEKSE